MSSHRDTRKGEQNVSSWSRGSGHFSPSSGSYSVHSDISQASGSRHDGRHPTMPSTMHARFHEYPSRPPTAPHHTNRNTHRHATSVNGHHHHHNGGSTNEHLHMARGTSSRVDGPFSATGNAESNPTRERRAGWPIHRDREQHGRRGGHHGNEGSNVSFGSSPMGSGSTVSSVASYSSSQSSPSGSIEGLRNYGSSEKPWSRRGSGWGGHHSVSSSLPSSTHRHSNHAFLHPTPMPSAPSESSVSSQRITPYLSAQPQLPQHSGVTVWSGTSNTYEANGGSRTILYFSSVQKRGGAFTTSDQETQFQLNRRKRFAAEGEGSNEQGVVKSSNEHPAAHCSPTTTTNIKKNSTLSSSSALSILEATNLRSKAERQRGHKTQEEVASLVGVFGGNAVELNSTSKASAALLDTHDRNKITDNPQQAPIPTTQETRNPYEKRKRNRFQVSSFESEEDEVDAI